MATQTVNRQVNIFIASGEAEKAYDRLVKKEQQLRAELEKATDPRIVARLNSELNKLQEPLDRATKKFNGELSPSVRDLRSTVDSLGRRLRQMSEQDADYAKVLIQYQAANVALKEQKKNIEAIQSVQKDTSTGAGSSFLGNLTANLVMRVADSLKSLGQQAIATALETEGVKRSFDRLNQPDLLDRLRTATKGTVTDLELMKRAITANNFQIPIERLGSLLEFAQRRARETGQSVDYLVDSIVTGIARKSPLILDNLGINIQRINEKFKQTGDFAQAAFNVVDEELSKMGPALETNADRIDRWKTRFSNALSDIGTGLFSVANNISDAFVERFGSDSAKAELLLRKGNEKIAAENEQARNSELSQIRDHQQRYAAADKAGRDKIVEQVKGQIQMIEREEVTANIEGKKRLSDTLKIRLDLWKKYYADIGNQLKSGDTIAALQKEIQASTEIRDNSIIGSKEFATANKRITELQARLDKLLGKNLPKAPENIFSRLNDQLLDQARELDTMNTSQVIKDINNSKIKYDKQDRLLKESFEKQKITGDQYNKLYLLSIDNREREHTLILEKWSIEYNKKLFEDDKKRKDKQKKIEEERLEQLIQFQEKLARNAAQVADKQLGGIRFQKEIDLLVATGRKRLSARLDLLQLEEQEELASADKTGKAVADIERKYQQLRKQETINHFVDLATRITDFSSNILNTVGQVFQTIAANENARIEDSRRATERDKDNYRRQLDSKYISNKEYDRKVSILDKQQEEKEKALRLRQFNREKAINFLQTTIQVARGVATALATPPAPNIGLAAAMGIMGAVQLGIIASTKPPKMAKGGLLDGPSHAEGGMPVINPRTGKIVAELEGKEAILSAATVRNNFALVSQLLDTSMNRRGATIRPLPYTPKYINTSAISSSLNTVRTYATGGLFERPTAATGMSDQLLYELSQTIERLNGVLNSGIRSRVALSEIQEQAERMSAIERDVTMR